MPLFPPYQQLYYVAGLKTCLKASKHPDPWFLITESQGDAVLQSHTNWYVEVRAEHNNILLADCSWLTCYYAKHIFRKQSINCLLHFSTILPSPALRHTAGGVTAHRCTQKVHNHTHSRYQKSDVYGTKPHTVMANASCWHCKSLCPSDGCFIFLTDCCSTYLS